MDPRSEEPSEAKVLKLLRREERPRSWLWIRRRLGDKAWYPLQDLIRKGQVIVTRSRLHWMYVAKES